MRGSKRATKGAKSIFDAPSKSFETDLFGESAPVKKKVEDDLFRLSSSESSRIKKLHRPKDDLFGSGNKDEVKQGENLLAADNLFMKSSQKPVKKVVEVQKKEEEVVESRSDKFVLDISFDEEKFADSNALKMNINAKIAVSSDFEKEKALKKEAKEASKRERSKTDDILFGAAPPAKDIFAEAEVIEKPLEVKPKQEKHVQRKTPVESTSIKLFGDDIFTKSSVTPQTEAVQENNVEIVKENDGETVKEEKAKPTVELTSMTKLDSEKKDEDKKEEEKKDEEKKDEEKVKPKTKTSVLFEDDDLLTAKKPKRPLFDDAEEKTTAPPKKLSKKRSLFDDDDDDFLMPKKTVQKRDPIEIEDFLPPVNKTESSVIKKPKKASFFDDDE